jgi:hypothetical protein
MIMKFVFSLFPFFVAQSLFAQEVEYPYKHDLKGATQECSERKFKAAYSDGKVVTGEYQADDKVGIRLFDREGRLVEFRTQDDDGKYKKVVVTYDGTGCWQKTTEYREGGRFHSSQEYKCNGRGNVVERVDFDYLYGDRPTAITTYKYDAAGHLTENHHRYGDPKPGPRRSPPQFVSDKYDRRYYEYDGNGFLVKWSIKREGIDAEFAALLGGFAEVTNDAQGRPIVEYSLNDLSAKEGKTKKLSKEMVYNAEGFLAQLVEYSGYGGPRTTYYEYTYDDHGNWITRTELKSSMKPGKANAVAETITVREIKYY